LKRIKVKTYLLAKKRFTPTKLGGTWIPKSNCRSSCICGKGYGVNMIVLRLGGDLGGKNLLP